MPWTLYRQILFDLLRLLLLSLGVLNVLTASAVAIKPLSEGLLTPGALLKFISYTIPSMVTFTMPFAAAFAGCLVYLRMVNANEVLACRASGMSYRTILGPAIGLGLVLAVFLFWMSNWVIPGSLLKAQRQLERDVPHMLVAKVQRGEPMEIPLRRYQGVLYADAADDSQPPPIIAGAEHQPNRMILLRGVALAVNDPAARKMRFFGTAEQADILIYQIGKKTWATLQLKNPSYYSADRNEHVQVEEPQIEPFVVPQVINDRFEAQSWNDLKNLRLQPESYSEVAEAKLQSIKPFAPQVLTSRLVELIEKNGSSGVWLNSPIDKQRYRLRGRIGQSSLNALTIVGVGQEDAALEVWSGGTETRRYRAKIIRLQAVEDQIDAEPYFSITLRDTAISSLDTGQAARRVEVKLPRATLPEPVAQSLLAMPASELSEQMMKENPEDSLNWRRGNYISKVLVKVQRKVTAEFNKRLATSLAALVILVGACVLAMRMQKRRPLEVYFWIFLTSALAVIVTQTGANILGDPDSSWIFGFMVLWLGPTIPAAVTLVLYRRLVQT